jgi:hypothetical protein
MWLDNLLQHSSTYDIDFPLFPQVVKRYDAGHVCGDLIIGSGYGRDGKMLRWLAQLRGPHGCRDARGETNHVAMP